MNEREQAIAELLVDLDRTLTENRRALDGFKNVLLGNGYVVKCGFFTLFIDVKNGMSVGAKQTAVLKANRFSKRDAETIAATVCNGRGEVGRAVHICDALKEAIEEEEKLRAMLVDPAGRATA